MSSNIVLHLVGGVILATILVLSTVLGEAVDVCADLTPNPRECGVAAPQSLRNGVPPPQIWTNLGRLGVARRDEPWHSQDSLYILV